MNSLLWGASPFDPNDNNDNGNFADSSTSNYIAHKKKSNHNKTQKKYPDQIIDTDKVNQVLQSIHANPINSDDNTDLGDFEPPPKPISAGVQKTTDLRESMSNLGSQPKPAMGGGSDDNLELNNYKQNYGSESSNHEYYRRFTPNYSGIENAPSPESTTPIYQTTGHHSSNRDVLVEKLNYMIHLLEEQHDERTHGVTEEVVLYSFLGIFIIFIVDSFSRIGKYTR